MLTRREFLAGAAAAGARPRRLNVVLILADDLGYGDLGCYGSATHHSPHLDRLAKEGTRFTDHYSASPVCSPARAALLTGLVPDRTGVTGVLRDGADHAGLALHLTTMADEFRRQGFRTALIGKWHLGMSEKYWPMHRGFDYFWGFLNGTIDYYTHVSLGGGGRGQRTTYENERAAKWDGYFPDLATARAVRFIEENSSAPYFLFFSLALPHTPFQVPERWAERYRGKMTESQALYAGMVECLDDSVGQVRAALERTGQWDRTILIFLSDNGWVKRGNPKTAEAGSNGPFRGGKYELYEGGIRVPCIVRWPGVTRAGSLSGGASWFPDWFPTLTGKPTRDGIDLRTALSSGTPPPQRDLCWRFEDTLVKTPLSHAIRRGRWKLLEVGSEKMLFDLADDPGERRSLIASQRAVAAELENRLQGWKRRLD